MSGAAGEGTASTSFQVAVVDAKLVAWMKQCPNPTAFADVVARQLWLELDAQCTACGDECKNKDLREDAAYWSSGNPICETCWTFHDGGTPAVPGYMAPPWPEKRAESTGVTGLVDGTLYCKRTNERLGTVEGYSPINHFAERVERDRYGPDGAEAGSIDFTVEGVRDCVPVTTEGFQQQARALRAVLIGM